MMVAHLIKKIKSLHVKFKDWYKRTLGYSHYKDTNKGFDPEMKLGRNIYGAKKMKDFIRKHDFLHGVVKHVFMVSGLKFLSWIAKDKIDEEVPDEYEYRYLKAFERAVDNGLVEWGDLYLYGKDRGCSPAEFIKRWINGVAGKTVIRGKNVGLTCARSDSAYFELFNRIAQCFKKELDKIETEAHIGYHNKKAINDTAYFIANTYRNNLVLTERVRQTSHWYDNEGKLVIRNLGGNKHLLKEICCDLHTTPDKARDELQKLIRENTLLWETVKGINKDNAFKINDLVNKINEDKTINKE